MRLLHPRARVLEAAILSKDLTDWARFLGLMFDGLEEITAVGCDHLLQTGKVLAGMYDSESGHGKCRCWFSQVPSVRVGRPHVRADACA